MMTVTTLRIDGETTQVGIDHMPRFSWELESDRRGVKQSRYQLQVAEDPAFESLVYDETVSSDQSVHVAATLERFESLTDYYVRVRVEAGGETSDWSETAHFLTAYLEPDWTACFITAETEADHEVSKGTYVRKDFPVEKAVKHAYVSSSALGVYHLYLDGERVGDDELAPGWTAYPKHLLYQVYDVTEALQDEGAHCIGAALGPGWYKGQLGFSEEMCHHYGSRTALILQLDIEYDDGTRERIVSDDTWEGADSPVIFSEIYHGETYDAAKRIPDWCVAGSVEGDWRSVEIIDHPKESLQAQSAGRIKICEQLDPVRIFTTPEGDTVLDVGQNMTGWIRFKATGDTGDRVVLKCFEVLDADGNVYLDNLRTARQTIEYRFDGPETVVYEPQFTFQGFEYVWISEWPGEAELADFAACVVHTDMEPAGTFASSHDLLNQLHHNILWGLKGNFLDVPTDCPQRDERLGWTGDAQVFARTAAYFMGVETFMTKWLKDLAYDQLPDGGVPHVIPDILSGQLKGKEPQSGDYGSTGWSDAAVIIPWQMYLMYGDRRMLEAQYPSMKGWVTFMRDHSEDYVWSFGHQFGDWLALDGEEGISYGATPDDLICMAYFAYSSRILAKAAKVLELDEDAETFNDLADRIAEAFAKRYFDDEGRLTVTTQTAHVLALHFGLTPPEYVDRTARALVDRLEANGGHLDTGFLGTPYLCYTLSEHGYLKEAYRLLLQEEYPGWLYSVKQGATTIWEHWDGMKPDGTMWSPAMNSFNHYAYGAIGEWIYRELLGLETDDEAPGFKHSIIRPHVGGDLRFARGSHRTPYGTLGSAWTREDDATVTLTVEIPANTTADIVLEQAAEVLEADGLQFAAASSDADAEGWSAEAGSGTYTVTYRLKD